MQQQPPHFLNRTDPPPPGDRHGPAVPETHSSWQTSHLPRLSAQETQVMLDIMRCWYHQEEFHSPKDCNWPLIWQYLDRHGLSGLAGSLCLDDLAEFPAGFEAEASRRFFSNQLSYEQARRSLSRVLKAAQELAIPLYVFKGPALVHQGYEEPGARYFSDIDLFTDSLQSYTKLLDHLGATPIKATEDQGLLDRMGECECAGFSLDGWELEFRYPLDPPGEPMFDVLQGNRTILETVPRSVDHLLDPDPSVHMVFLIQHMAVHHLFSRFFWFLDLAVLFRKCQGTIDIDRISDELDRIGQNNAAAIASEFCRQYIDPEFPIFTPKLPAWNYSVMKNLTKPEDVAGGRYGIYHKKRWDRFLGYFFSLMSFYYIADPGKTFFRLGFGTYWTMYRLKRSFSIQFEHPLAGILIGKLIATIAYPLARIIALFIGIKKKGNSNQ